MDGADSAIRDKEHDLPWPGSIFLGLEKFRLSNERMEERAVGGGTVSDRRNNRENSNRSSLCCRPAATGERADASAPGRHCQIRLASQEGALPSPRDGDRAVDPDWFAEQPDRCDRRPRLGRLVTILDTAE